MSHDHHHHHTDARSGASRSQGLAITLVLVVGYAVAEVIGGLLTGSLALMADAGHMVSDAAALGLTLFVMWFARKPPTPKRTYGYHRAEILAALANGATLGAIAIFIFIEAYERFRQPPEVQGALMLAIAAGGLGVNLVGLWLLRGRGENLNVHGAWLHVFSDALGSVQAIAAGALIWAFGWHWADPLASVLIASLVVYSSWALIKQSVAILMEGAPGHIDVEDVENTLRGIPCVDAVHDLHVWTITSGLTALSTHLVVADGADGEAILRQAQQILVARFPVRHTTIQIDRSRGDCGHARHDLV